MIYIAMAYRWGYLNGGHYHIYVGTDREKAVALAQAENSDRGGKYGCVVLEFGEDAEGKQQQQQVAYFPSAWGEDALFHNYRIDMFQSLGHKFHDFAQGTIWLPENHPEFKDKDGNPTRVLKPHKVDPPAWAVAELKQAEEVCRIFTEAADTAAKVSP